MGHFRKRPAFWILSLAVICRLSPSALAQAIVPIPELALWEQNMTTYGQQWCDYLSNSGYTFNEKLDSTYYDGIRVYHQIADYTGNVSWNSCATLARNIYRDGYVLPNNGQVPGYWNFTHGLTMDFLKTGEDQSKNAAILLSQNAAYAGDGTSLAWTQGTNRSREVAYAIMSYINAEKVGAAARARLPQLVDPALGHIDQWFISKTSRCPSVADCPPGAAGQYYIQPFMVGLTANALIMYHEKTGDSRALPNIQIAMDSLGANAWVLADESFWYEHWVADPSIPFPAKGGAPDLNLLIAPAFGWLYKQTGSILYRDKGDQIFAGGVKFAWLGRGKQFNQNYAYSFDYVRSRSGAPASSATPPA